MRFELTEEQGFLVDTVSRFLTKELPSTSLRPWLRRAKGDAFRDWWRRCGLLGWSGILAGPEHADYGPVSDVPLVDAALVAELAGRSLAPNALIGTSAAVDALSTSSDADSSVLDGLLESSTLASLAWEERGGVWEPGELRTCARVEGDELVLDGEKVMVADAATADVLLVACRLDAATRLVLVPAGAAGVTITQQRGLDLLREFGTVRLEGVRVSRTAITGSADLDATLRLVTCLQLAESVGALDRLFELTLEYARNRHAFGRPIGSFQALKHRIADVLLWVEGCKATVDAAIDAVGQGSAESDLLVSIAKAYVGDRSIQIAQQCTQMFGGIGLTWEHDAHLYLRRVTANRAAFGTPEQHRIRIANLLGANVEGS